MNVKIKKVAFIPEGYIGMNYMAFKSHHLGKYPYSKHTIEVLNTLHGGRLRRTIRHEKVELALMEKGMSYHKAHKIALREEGK
jgi:hypothetical protein